jgi:lipoprotein-anchoring transpeptidase ErfK/SrfK
VRVRLPWRPNGAAGWLATGAVTLSPTRWTLAVSRASRTLEVYFAGRPVRRFPVVVGKLTTPTPAGLFAILGAWRWHPLDFSGAWILALTAHSNVLRRFEGGTGRVGIHGRGGASLLDPLGSARSHGCIRLANRAISWLALRIGSASLAGIPVSVR